jgi:molybdopterin converting factor small subunit
MTIVVDFEALWDDEAKVWWTSASGDLGIATEADTVEALRERLKQIVPDFLETSDEVRINLTVKVSDTVRAA